MSKLPFYLLVGLLMLAGVGLSLYRHVQQEVPWTPGEQRQIWAVEAEVNFNAQGGPVLVDMALPSDQQGFRLLTQNTASPGYGLSFLEENGARRARWSIREASGEQQLYYTAQFLVVPWAGDPEVEPPPLREDIVWKAPTTRRQPRIEQLGAQRGPLTFARELIREFDEDRR